VAALASWNLPCGIDAKDYGKRVEQRMCHAIYALARAVQSPTSHDSREIRIVVSVE